MYNFEALSDKDRTQMCEDIGIKTPDELFDVIPSRARLNKLDLPEALSELETQKKLKKAAQKK